jgi:hypothetical protein
MNGDRTRARQRGQSMTEYALVVGFWAAMLFLPTPLLHDPKTGNAISVFMLFIQAFDVYINSFHTVITLPIP